jgi:hypothetical protein
MILLSSRLIQYMTYTRSLQASPHSHMRPHFPGPDDMKSRFRRTDNWRKGLVSDFSPLFWSGSVEYCRRPLAERAGAEGCADTERSLGPATSPFVQYRPHEAVVRIIGRLEGDIPGPATRWSCEDAIEALGGVLF